MRRRYLAGTGWVCLLAIGTVGAQERPEEPPPAAATQPTSIFDFGGFNDAPPAAPGVRERPRPGRTPEPALVTPPGTTPPATTPPATPPALQPPALQPPVVRPPVVVPPPGGDAPRLIPPPVVAPPVVLPPPNLVPVPPAAAVGKATAAVRQAFAAELKAATARPARRALALKLLAAGGDASLDPATRFARLAEARDQAAAAGDALLTTQALDRLVAGFDVDELAVRSQAVLKLAPAAAAVHDAHAVAAAAARLIEAAVRADDFDAAEKLAAVAEPAAAKVAGRDAVLLGRVKTVVAEMRQAKAAYDAAKPALEQAARNPKDAAALLAAGRYTCFVKQDWAAGLPMLAASADARLKAVAARDLTNPTTPTDQTSLANAWWDAAAAEPPAHRPAVLRRAARWYQPALAATAAAATAGSPDPARATAESRVGQASAAGRTIEPGLVAELFFDPGLRYRQRVRVDPAIDADFSAGPPDPALGREIFGVRWTGLLKAPKTGTYTLSLRAQESARVWVDGVPVLTAHRRSDKVDAEVLLTEGLHDVRVHFIGHLIKPRVQLSWTPPGAAAEVPVGPQHFFRDARAGAEHGGSGASLLASPLARTPRIGGYAGGFLDELSARDPDGLLAGFRVTTGLYFRHTIVRSFQPVFRTTDGGLEDGPWRGARGRDEKAVIARDGYAVAGVMARGASRLDGFSVTFARVKPDGTLDLKDVYDSEWVGGTGGDGPMPMGLDGRPVLGVCGRCGVDVESLGLIQKAVAVPPPPPAGNSPVVSARWGTGKKWADVSQRVRMLTRAGAASGRPKVNYRTLDSDPVPGVQKKLEVTYLRDGKRETVTLNEGQELVLPGLAAAGNR